MIDVFTSCEEAAKRVEECFRKDMEEYFMHRFEIGMKQFQIDFLPRLLEKASRSVRLKTHRQADGMTKIVFVFEGEK